MKRVYFAMLLVLVAVFATSCLVVPIPRGLIEFDIDIPAVDTPQAGYFEIPTDEINLEELPAEVTQYISKFKLKITANWVVPEGTTVDPVDFKVYVGASAYTQDPADLLVSGTFSAGSHTYSINSDSKAAQALLNAVASNNTPYITVWNSGFTCPVQTTVTVGISGTVTMSAF